MFLRRGTKYWRVAISTLALLFAVAGCGDDDSGGDGFATVIFADEPNPFSPDCGTSPAPICWPSDHEGMQADINCG